MGISHFPSWRDLSLPTMLPKLISEVTHGRLLDFLIRDRIFCEKNEVLYNYRCRTCGYEKQDLTFYENCVECPRCLGDTFHATPHRTLNCNDCRLSTRSNETLLNDVCARMNGHHL